LRNVSDLVGIPYARHGRDESGLDCFGLIWLIAERNGTPIDDPWYRGYDPSLAQMGESIGLEKLDTFETGSVIEMLNNGRLHLGYAIDKKRMIHAALSDGVIVEDIGTYPVKGYWKFARGI